MKKRLVTPLLPIFLQYETACGLTPISFKSNGRIANHDTLFHNIARGHTFFEACSQIHKSRLELRNKSRENDDYGSKHRNQLKTNIEIEKGSSYYTESKNPMMEMMDRRKLFHDISAVSIGCLALNTAVPTKAAADSNTNDDYSSMEKLKLGKGIWNDNDGSTVNFSSADLSEVNNLEYNMIPPSFFNYACRFLIHYDPAVRNMWEERVQAITMKSNTSDEQNMLSEEDQQRLDEFFESLIGVVHNAILLFLSSKEKIEDGKTGFDQLAQIFISKYAENGKATANDRTDIAERHIAILFSLLPAESQPITELKKLASILDSQNFKAKSTSQDKYALLPPPYTISYSRLSSSYTLTPSLTEPLDGISPLVLSTIPSSNEGGAASSIGIANSRPLTRARPTYTPTIYALFGLAGGLGCCLTHTIVVPLDVVKTRIQTDPMLNSNESELISNGAHEEQRSSNKILKSANTILEKEGLSGLFLGLQATILGYLWYGVSVYPSYTFFKRFLLFQCASLLPLGASGAGSFEEIISLIAGAMSAVLASLGLTPLEACRIRAVAEPQIYAPLGVTGTASVIAKENPELGWSNLYAGLPSLLTRQVVFGSMKFLAFEKAVDAIYLIAPSDWSIPGSAGSLTVSLLAGGLAGCISSIVSQPADSVLTYVAQNSSGGKALGVVEGCRVMIREGGIGALYRGLGSRCVWAGSIIAGQFLLYDVFRAMFGVDTESLKQVFQIVIDS